MPSPVTVRPSMPRLAAETFWTLALSRTCEGTSLPVSSVADKMP